MFFIGLLLLFYQVQPLFLVWMSFVITPKVFGYYLKSPQSSFDLASQHLRQRHQFPSQQYAEENKVNTMNCLRIGKTSKAKTPPSDFKVTTLENPLLSQQAVTSKGISVPYTNLQLNPYRNTQLDLFCSNNLSFSIHGSQYVTNQSMHGSKYVTNH